MATRRLSSQDCIAYRSKRCERRRDRRCLTRRGDGAPRPSTITGTPGVGPNLLKRARVDARNIDPGQDSHPESSASILLQRGLARLKPAELYWLQ